MIKQQIFLDDKEIITIYHEGFSAYHTERKLDYQKDIAGHQISFKEFCVQNLVQEDINFDRRVDGFLHKNHNKNPYTDYCCNYSEFINSEKSFLQEYLNKKDIFCEISDFVKKWTGLNMETNPHIVFNTLVFRPNILEVEITLAENKQDINLQIKKNQYSKLKHFIKFKVGDILVETKYFKEKPEIIKTTKEWNSFDLEIYDEDNNLLYAHYNFIFAQAVNLNMEMLWDQTKKTLNTSSKTVNLQTVSSELIEVGEKTNENIASYLYEEKLISKKIKDNSLFEFLGRNQYEKALEIFKKISDNSNYDKMWIFDPYFIDYSVTGGKERLEDIITVLAQVLSLEKNIVFYCNEDCNNQFNEFLDGIRTLKKLTRKTQIKKLNFTFYATNENFHDRFIIFEKNSNLKGYMLGTSLNSFGDNYSTILELKEKQLEIIYNTLKKGLLTDEKIILRKNI